jgi:hypothetical protein
VSVFLRWGVLGILSVAALLYVYNASKRVAEVRGQSATGMTAPAATAAADAGQAGEAAEPAGAPAESVAELSPHCEVELLIARRALDLRRQDTPLDRVLRMQEIAWQEPAARRERLEQVATRWYGQETPIGAAELKAAVVSDCEQSAPAP